MELKDFVKNVLIDLVNAVEETRSESCRDMSLRSNTQTGQSIEFDIAVTVEDTASKTGG